MNHLVVEQVALSAKLLLAERARMNLERLGVNARVKGQLVVVLLALRAQYLTTGAARELRSLSALGVQLAVAHQRRLVAILQAADVAHPALAGVVHVAVTYEMRARLEGHGAGGALVGLLAGVVAHVDDETSLAVEALGAVLTHMLLDTVVDLEMADEVLLVGEGRLALAALVGEAAAADHDVLDELEAQAEGEVALVAAALQTQLQRVPLHVLEEQRALHEETVLAAHACVHALIAAHAAHVGVTRRLLGGVLAPTARLVTVLVHLAADRAGAWLWHLDNGHWRR